MQLVDVKQNTHKRKIVFLGVGIANTLLDFLFYTALTQTVLEGSQHIAVAGIVSGTFALICAFLTHRLITWRGTNIGHRTVMRFALCTGFGMWVIRPFLLSVFVHLQALYDVVYKITRAGHLPFSQSFIAATGAFGLMTVVMLVYNFYMYEKFVFAQPASATSRTDEENR